MKKQLLTRWNLVVCDNIVDTIQAAMHCRTGFGQYRQSLASLRDELHSLCRDFELSGDAEDFGEVYFALFDGLAFLTDALRPKAINASHLSNCRNAMHNALAKAVNQ